MYDREDVELALLALEEGMSVREAAELVGCGTTAVREWAAGRVPHARSGRRRRIGGERRRREEAPVTDSERAAYEAAMTENMLLRAVLDDLKAAGSGPRSISNRRKAELGERLREATGLPLREITAFLRISKSSYEYHRARLGRDKYAALRAAVREAFGAGRGAYGYRRVHAELARRGTRVSEKVVRRVMREEGLEARRPRRRRYGSYRGERGARPAPNLLLADAARDRHEFRAPAPGRVLVTDVSEFRLPDDPRRVYLSPVVDLYDGRVVCASVGTSPSKGLVQGMLASAVAAVGHGFVLHSDRGWHYRTPDWAAACRSAGVARSMSRLGHSPDNAAMEGLFGRLKVEMFRGRDWSGWTAEAFGAELSRYLSWYNSGRLKRFRDPDGTTRYETIDGRRGRLGLTV